MNQVFDFKRWLLLTGKHWSENRKKYLLSMAAIAALLVIWYTFVFMLEPSNPFEPEMQVATYFIGIAIVGCLYGSMLFGELASGPKAMHYLSVPASAFEKLTSALFYGIVLFFICYTVIFYLVDFTMIKLGNGILENYWAEKGVTEGWRRMEVVNVFGRPDPAAPDMPNIFLYFLLMFFNLQSAFILGSIYFPGYSFIKTAIVLMVLIIAVIFFAAEVLDNIMPTGSFYEGFTSYRLNVEGPDVKGVKLSDWLSALLKYLFMYGFLPVLWSATYFRLKEKEV